MRFCAVVIYHLNFIVCLPCFAEVIICTQTLENQNQSFRWKIKSYNSVLTLN